MFLCPVKLFLESGTPFFNDDTALYGIYFPTFLHKYFIDREKKTQFNMILLSYEQMF